MVNIFSLKGYVKMSIYYVLSLLNMEERFLKKEEVTDSNEKV